MASISSAHRITFFQIFGKFRKAALLSRHQPEMKTAIVLYLFLFVLRVSTRLTARFSLLRVKIHYKIYFQRVRLYTPQKFDNCRADTPIQVNVLYPRSASNSAIVSAHVSVNEEIIGDIDFVSLTNRCTVDMKTCGKHLTFRSKHVCDALKVENAFYSDIFNSFSPSIECPIKAGNYTLQKTVFDLKYFQIFPIEGYVYSVIFKWLQVNKTERTIMCVQLDVKVEVINKRI